MSKHYRAALLPTFVPVILMFAALFPAHRVFAQENQHTLTDAYIVNLTKSGLVEQAITLMSPESAIKTDASPDAIGELRRAVVSNAVSEARLAAPKATFYTNPSPGLDCSGFLDKALDSIGPREEIRGIRSIRSLSDSVRNLSGGSVSLQGEQITLYSGSIYLSTRYSSGLTTTVVLTPDSQYMLSGKMKTSVPPETIEDFLTTRKLDPIHISQHRDQYACTLEGTEEIEKTQTSKLRLTGEGIEGHWNIDPSSGRILRMSFKLGAAEAITEYSDWRQARGIYFPFKRHFIGYGMTADVTIREFQVNPAIDANIFQPPAGQIPAVTFVVLQNRFVPYVVDANGGVSAECAISGMTNAPLDPSTYANLTFGASTNSPKLRMNCKLTNDTAAGTVGLNAMLIQTSDGNAYIIACDPDQRGSNCSALKAGESFFAVRTARGFRVQVVNSESKVQEMTYRILKVRPSHE